MKTILVVDDSRPIRMAIRRILESVGLQVAEAGDGREAIAYLEAKGVPDCILLDIDMPNMDGLSCLRSLRGNTKYQGTMVVMCTTHTSMEKISAAIETGANEYIMKPFDAEIIKGKLEALSVL